MVGYSLYSTTLTLNSGIDAPTAIISSVYYTSFYGMMVTTRFFRNIFGNFICKYLALNALIYGNCYALEALEAFDAILYPDKFVAIMFHEVLIFYFFPLTHILMYYMSYFLCTWAFSLVLYYEADDSLLDLLFFICYYMFCFSICLTCKSKIITLFFLYFVISFPRTIYKEFIEEKEEE